MERIITKSFARLMGRGIHRGFITIDELNKSLGKRNLNIENLEQAFIYILDEKIFLSNVHERQFNILKKKQQLTQTIIGGLLILMIGFLSVESLDKSPIIYNYYVENNQEVLEIDTTAYFEDMALILIDSDGDIYETAKFLYELDIEYFNQ